MLDPWVIEKIKRQEEERRRREEEGRREQPTVPADDRREMPEKPADRQPDPGYEMPNPNDPKRDESPKEEKSDRGVTVIDIGGNGDGDGEDPNVIDITKLPDIPPDDGSE